MKQKELPKFLQEKTLKARIQKLKKGTTLNKSANNEQYQAAVSI